MARHTLTARIRENKGKEAAKKLRRENQIPAIFYGPNTDQVMLSVNYSDLRQIMKKTAGENIILGLDIESEKGTNSKIVILKELQSNPIKDTYLHADFYEISMDREITIDIPIRLLNTPNGVKNGGILQHIRREITISCLPDKLIEYLDLDVAGLDIGDSIHVDDIDFPEGIKTDLDGKTAVATVIAPALKAEVEEVEEEVEEAKEEKETDSAAGSDSGGD